VNFWRKKFSDQLKFREQAIASVPCRHCICVYKWSALFVVSAINAENGEANKVRNTVNGETAAVPAVARFYKVICLLLWTCTIINFVSYLSLPRKRSEWWRMEILFSQDVCLRLFACLSVHSGPVTKTILVSK